MPFQRSSKERRSLHVPSASSYCQKAHARASSGPDAPSKTSLDLELDLAAQQSKLNVLSEEIERLRVIKNRMEEAKANGDKELPIWFQENEKLQRLIAGVGSLKVFFFHSKN